jgi:hypothetical protein
MSVKPWLRALSRLYPVPAAYRVPLLDVNEAKDMLRCGDEAFSEMLAAGLPCDEGPDGPLFDRNDLTNLALDAGTGESRPERAVRYALRWMREDPRAWEKLVSWTFSIQMAAPAEISAEDPESWSHTRFLPELAGGLIEDWESTTGVRITPTHFEFDGPGPVTFSGRITTAGRVQELVSPTLRKITSEFLERGYRWVRLPEACQYDHEPILASGVAPCVAASTYLEQEFRAAGYVASTRGGWILGMLDLAHSWIEVVDDDGLVKPIDAVLERLSGLADSPHPGLAGACLGSRINRMLPAAMPAGAPGGLHHSAGGTRSAITRTVIRRVGAR